LIPLGQVPDSADASASNVRDPDVVEFAVSHRKEWLRPFSPPGYRRHTQRGARLAELRGAGQELEISLMACAVDRGRAPQLDHKCGYGNIGVERHTHQALSAVA
jgi:hypothetical protein